MKLFSQYDRFELEQDIIKAWTVADEIGELIRQHLDRPMGPFDEDELANRLQAIQYMAEMRFQRLWDGFEVMVTKKQWDSAHTLVCNHKAVPDVDIEVKLKKGSKK